MNLDPRKIDVVHKRRFGSSLCGPCLDNDFNKFGNLCHYAEIIKNTKCIKQN